MSSNLHGWRRGGWNSSQVAIIAIFGSPVIFVAPPFPLSSHLTWSYTVTNSLKFFFEGDCQLHSMSLPYHICIYLIYNIIRLEFK